MSAPNFTYIHVVSSSAGTTGWASGNANNFSSPSSGDTLANLSANINLSNVNLATGIQTSNTWSAAHPIVVGQNSYEFVWGFYVKAAATNSLANLKVYNNGTYSSGSITGVNVKMGTVAATGYTAPVTTASSIATFEVDHWTSGSPLQPATPANSVNSMSDPVYMQLLSQAQAGGGNQSVMPTLTCAVDWS